MEVCLCWEVSWGRAVFRGDVWWEGFWWEVRGVGNWRGWRGLEGVGGGLFGAEGAGGCGMGAV